MKVYWERSKDGYTRSHEHRFDIEPLFRGHATVQAYRLNDKFRPLCIRSTVHYTQLEAKQWAEVIATEDNDD